MDNFLKINQLSNSAEEFDIVILVTDHDNLNYKSFGKYSNLLVDTRGIIKEKYSNVISL